MASVPEGTHADALTRDEITPAVHYLRFPFEPAQVSAFAGGPVALAIRHPEYQHRVELADATREALIGDLEGRTEPLPLG